MDHSIPIPVFTNVLVHENPTSIVPIESKHFGLREKYGIVAWE